MSIELPKDIHKEAMASIIRYFHENREEQIGNIAASGLLGFFLEEIGPSIYNKAVADVQERLQMYRILILNFMRRIQYWLEYKRKGKSKPLSRHIKNSELIPSIDQS